MADTFSCITDGFHFGPEPPPCNLMTITQSQIDTLAEFFNCTDRPDKITAQIDQVTGKVVITIDDMDEQWLKHLSDAT